MNKFALAISTVAISAASMVGASAADLPAKAYYKAPAMFAAYDWSGFYAGVNGGAAIGRDCWNFVSQAGAAIAAGSDGCHNSYGAIFGGQLGYRWQTGSTVFGLEAQGDWANIRSDNNSLILLGLNNQTKTDAFGLFTGQLGYALPSYPALFYVKGGAGVTHNNYVQNTIGTALNGTASSTIWGGAAGAGLEIGFAPHWSLALEYDHVFAGKKTVTLVGAGLPSVTESTKPYLDIISLKINYKFGGPVVARY